MTRETAAVAAVLLLVPLAQGNHQLISSPGFPLSLTLFSRKSPSPKRAVNKLELTRKKNAQSGLQAWMSTLSSVIGECDDDYNNA
ncbi:hypothetical protein WN943_027367 [Citrus x changshan-huyou]